MGSGGRSPTSLPNATPNFPIRIGNVRNNMQCRGAAEDLKKEFIPADFA